MIESASKNRQPLKRDLDENWYWYLTGENKEGYSSQYQLYLKRIRRASILFPGWPRCIECNLPLSGLGSWLTRTSPASYSPRLCNKCELEIRKGEAGAEVELSMLFADIRGSTGLAQTTSTSEFKQLIQRFYQATTDILIRHNALVNRLMGDQVIGLFVPHFAGTGHARVAVAAALDILRATGHEDQKIPWVPVGIGVHTGFAYVGAVGTANSVNEIAVLGSAPNLAARLSSQAADGEVIISKLAAAAAGLDSEEVAQRYLDIKGFAPSIAVRVLKAMTNQEQTAWEH